MMKSVVKFAPLMILFATSAMAKSPQKCAVEAQADIAALLQKDSDKITVYFEKMTDSGNYRYNVYFKEGKPKQEIFKVVIEPHKCTPRFDKIERVGSLPSNILPADSTESAVDSNAGGTADL